ncbi:flagellar biosynthesis anti-sigma factor FlgM [Thiohalobacter sp. IOR34]|uniref:flagellar biosynthesis anti-sigma factor FlgM n=1 Tax=Thiohalobacter sp. IOR34 TaxID=3057176 RepID=UPI0025AECFF6|nr:flagellar biosynthesis anti-sigma factor FlgM [Thiohalobacter sp. IOR34]WJW74618.1 flagellar biosynthesis anti-sigma factor FlgM [Thiohalobacter sp. IOR34]
MAIEINNLPPSQVNLEASGQSSAAAQPATEAKTDAKAPASPPPSDQISLTPEAQKLRDLETSVAELPQVDSDRVNAVKTALANGTFEINPERIAGKMIDFERALSDMS